MTDRRLFLAGLAAGAIGELLVGRLRSQPRRMPYLDVGQQVLAETRGPVQAVLLAARVQARYDELYAHRLRFAQLALRQHYEEGALPSLALYQTLRKAGADQEAALAEMDRIIAAQLEHSGRRRLVQVLGRMPDPFAVLGFLNRWALKYRYPPEGWRFEWVEDSDCCIAYDARECFYVNVLAAYGAPELTAHLCAIDDLLYDNLPGISWERTQTLGRGDDRCDFRFRRTDASRALTASEASALARYVCPTCKGKLESAGNALHCAACQVTYPLVGGILDFLREDPEEAIGPLNRAVVRSIVRLYETPLWYVPILKLAGGKGAPSYGEVIRQMVGLMDVRQGLLLDVACGPGTWGRRLASPAMAVHGIDISWSMLRQGVRMAEDKRMSQRSGAIHFAHARVEALPFHDGQFDAAYCGGALHGFPDTVGSLREIGRTLKPGAPLVVLTFLNRDQPFVRMRRRAEARNDKLLKLHLFEVVELEEVLAQAGFEGFEPLVYGGVIIFRARKAK